MASSSKAPCATCGNKAAGIFRCEGCVQVFCRKHLNEHRDVLNHQFDEIVMEHDALQQSILENKDKKNNQHPILKQIDRWEKDSIMKIRQIAQEAREKVDQLISSNTVSKELHDLAERLQKARADDDYVETDLCTWTNTLQKLRKDIHSYSPSISIQEDRTQILIGRMLISTTANQRLEATTRQIEKFEISTGPIRISNNGLSATHVGLNNEKALLRGSGEYSSGKHHIRFLFKKKSVSYITSFYIVSKLKLIDATESKFVDHGWTSIDDVKCNNSL